MPRLGAHQSAAGGLYRAFARNSRVGGEALQIFTANQRQWHAPALGREEIRLFREQRQLHPGMPVAAHASYLINLAATEADKAAKSVAGMVEELRRCQQLGIEALVIHPGSHGGAGIEAGLVEVVRHLDLSLEQSGALDSEVSILLETTAGQGTSLGSRFEELAWVMARSRYPAHLGVCVDTCHIFAAGYELRTPEGYCRTVAELERSIGCDRIRFIHLNDSKKGLGSRIDRHAHIGEGEIGLEGFRLLLNDPRFRHLGMTLETDKGPDLAEDIENLARLRALLADQPIG